MGLVRDIIYDYDTTGKIIVEVSLEDKMRLNKGSYIAVVNTFLSGAELHIHLNTYVDDFFEAGFYARGTNGRGYDAIRTGEDLAKR